MAFSNNTDVLIWDSVLCLFQGSPRTGYGAGPPIGPSQVPHQIACSPRIPMPQHTGMNMPPPQAHVGMPHHYQTGIFFSWLKVFHIPQLSSFQYSPAQTHTHTHTHVCVVCFYFVFSWALISNAVVYVLHVWHAPSLSCAGVHPQTHRCTQLMYTYLESI